jgi:pyruvate/2-oxoacid:ferredoxin oxidoreductase beta subunit
MLKVEREKKCYTPGHVFFSPGCICFFYLKYILNIFKNVRKKSNKNIVCISMS